ncbi:hypothetical protein CARUB_v10012140mg [Capsella rubella]|uniref:PB1 domain-containing protein n=1 Tax=Capsella rubella TaxID=81985 RepID=R0GL48_9BRAS|nr:uncharacterized protein LOC17900656 [Capsella rubella]EOA36697.1 hypothetical protein CARUB_v10012140mg [Capsella rubella]
MEPPAPSLDPKLRLLCSFGGRIIPLPPENYLHYIGGETRLVVVPRGVCFVDFFKLLSEKLLSGRSFSLKYKLPGCDFDSLITVSDNDDLENMIAEYDSTRFRRIRLFLFPLNHPELTRQSVTVNRLLGLESPIFTSSSSVLASPIFPPSSGPPLFVQGDKVHATAGEENRRKDEVVTTSASILPPENTAAADDTGRLSDRETELVEIQDQPRPMVQEPLPQQQPLIIYYLPVWPVQPHMVNYPMAAYALPPPTEHSSRLDNVPEIQENAA